MVAVFRSCYQKSDRLCEASSRSRIILPYKRSLTTSSHQVVCICGFVSYEELGRKQILKAGCYNYLVLVCIFSGEIYDFFYVYIFCVSHMICSICVS